MNAVLDAKAAELHDALTATFSVSTPQRQDMAVYQETSIQTLVDDFAAMLLPHQTQRMLADGHAYGMNKLTLFIDETIAFRSLVKATIPKLQAIVTTRFGANVLVRWHEHIDPIFVETSKFGTLICDWSGQTGDYIGEPNFAQIQRILDAYRFISFNNASIHRRIPSEPPVVKTEMRITRQSIPNTLVHRNLGKHGYNPRYLRSSIDVPGPAPQSANRIKRQIQDIHAEIEQLEAEYQGALPLAAPSQTTARSHTLALDIQATYAQLHELEQHANLVVYQKPPMFCVCRVPCKSLTGPCPTCNLEVDHGQW